MPSITQLGFTNFNRKQQVDLNKEIDISQYDQQLGDLYITPQGINRGDSEYIINVGPNGNIQEAIEILHSKGGGIVNLNPGTFNINYDINLYSKIELIGFGKDNTILEFNGLAKGIKIIGSLGNEIKNFAIKDLTIQNSNNTAGLDIDYCDFWKIENVKVASCDQIGLRIQNSDYFQVSDLTSINNTGNNISVATSLGAYFSNFYSSGSGVNGCYIDGSDDITGMFLNCVSESNTGDGFDLSGGLSSVGPIVFVGCRGNGAIGFDVDLGKTYLIDCTAEGQSTYGIDISQDCNLVNVNIDDSSDRLNISGGKVIVIGTDFDAQSDVGTAVVMTDQAVNSSLNIGANPTLDKKYYFMKNTSGSSLAIGDIVVLKSVAAANEITTTTTTGDSKVFGMMMSVVNNNFWGNVLIEGFTTKLKVNGTTDIAVGDWLSTYSEAGISAKASNGHTVFAIALEAYANNDSSGVIDALLIKPFTLPLVSGTDYAPVNSPIFTGTVTLTTPPAFVAGDKYLVINASGNIHESAVGPAS